MEILGIPVFVHPNLEDRFTVLSEADAERIVNETLRRAGINGFIPKGRAVEALRRMAEAAFSEPRDGGEG